MASLFTHLLEGSNLAAYDKLARDGDLSQLGVIGRNNTLIAITERASHELAVAAAISDAKNAAQAAETAALVDEAFLDRQERDRLEALRLTGFKSLPKSQRVAALPDSDEGVDEFLSRLF